MIPGRFTEAVIGSLLSRVPWRRRDFSSVKGNETPVKLSIALWNPPLIASPRLAYLC